MCDFTRPQTPILTAPDFARARQAAEETLRSLKIIYPPVDPRFIAEALGISVNYVKFAFPTSEEISGYIQPDKNQIVVNEELPTNRILFTIAHELGHFLLHKQYVKSHNYNVFPRYNNYPKGKPPEEVEADIFAANLLVPFYMLKKYENVASTHELAKMFCVSEDVIVNQLYWLRATSK
ncbi:ImmA/IrrE family metallo-endopeptidase [Acetobacter pasteurianus]|uniref:ImmA/IrrE family metallo-endopeptidase n=1 Tax=Acetobacter TaxID=434 RepID=UPI0006837AEF|nr:ImmA/IrrE family metallo-endopeptidase [Acetobacter pasteurianus]ALR88178.1 hypothetical protein DB34_13540 [Acetobacter pasteurianus]